MPAVRKTKSRPHTLIGRPSPFNTGVTLFETRANEDVAPKVESDAPSEEKSALRRSPRKRVVVKHEDVEPSGFVDIEDVVRSSPSNPVKHSPTTIARTFKYEDEPDTKPMFLAKDTKSQKSKPVVVKGGHAPANWQRVIELIRSMREAEPAPVDTMGSHMAGAAEEDPKNARLSCLISLMLSSQTKDEITDAAVKLLRNALGGSITLQAIIDAPPETISQAIGKVGFWRRKTEYIKKTAEKLREEFDGDVPNTIEGLCSLPGVGEKMGYLTLHHAWGLNMGIGVDVHVHRITNRLGWHNPPTKTPEKTRINLESWLPSEYHREINHLLVGFGQTLCQPQRPQCGRCRLNDEGLCPKIGVAKVTTKRKIDLKKDEAEVKITTEVQEA